MSDQEHTPGPHESGVCPACVTEAREGVAALMRWRTYDDGDARANHMRLFVLGLLEENAARIRKEMRLKSVGGGDEEDACNIEKLADLLDDVQTVLSLFLRSHGIALQLGPIVPGVTPAATEIEVQNVVLTEDDADPEKLT